MRIESLNTKREINNIWMFHRIKTTDNMVSDIYKQRGMLHTMDELYCLIDKALHEGYSFGSIPEAINNDKIIHLTFDDGYKEHLFVARELKKKYNLSYHSITFAINIRNSFFSDKLCMDMVYQLIDNDSLNDLTTALNINLEDLELKDVKDMLFSSTKHIQNINKYVDMRDYFLNKEDLLSLCKMFSIASHCVNHCYLTSLSNEKVYEELKASKDYLSSTLSTEVITICFPDGKHSNNINKISKEIGYKFGLSISPKTKEYKEFNLKRSIPRCI